MSENNGTARAPRVSVILDRERWMVFDMSAMARFERRVAQLRGIPKITFAQWQKELAQDGPETLSADETIAVFHACLLRDDPALTEERVGEIIYPGILGDMADKLMQALDMVQGKERPEVGGAPTGSSSGP